MKFRTGPGLGSQWLWTEATSRRRPRSLGGESLQPLTNFYGFHIKNTDFSTLFLLKKVMQRVQSVVTIEH